MDVKELTCVGVFYKDNVVSGFRLALTKDEPVDVKTGTKTQKHFRFISDSVENIRKAMISGGICVKNLTVTNNGEIKGVGGDLSRYTKLAMDGKLLSPKSWFVLSKHNLKEGTGYRLVGPDGQVLLLRTEDIVKNKLPLANGKLVDTGSGAFISAISGSYEEFDAPKPAEKLERTVAVAPSKDTTPVPEMEEPKKLQEDPVFGMTPGVIAEQELRNCALETRYQCINSQALADAEDKTNPGQSCTVKWTRLLMALQKIHPVSYSILKNMRTIFSTDPAMTMGVNTKEFMVGIPFLQERTSSELLFVLLHEARHVMLGHTIRRGDRHPMLYNIAADYVVNSMLAHEYSIDSSGRYLAEEYDANGVLQQTRARPLKAGDTCQFDNGVAVISNVTAPKDVCLDIEHYDYLNYSVEQIYDMLYANTDKYSVRPLSADEVKKLMDEGKLGTPQSSSQQQQSGNQQGDQSNDQGQQSQSGQSGQSQGQQSQAQQGQGQQSQSAGGGAPGQQSQSAGGGAPGQQSQAQQGQPQQGQGQGQPGQADDAFEQAADMCGQWAEITITHPDGTQEKQYAQMDIDVTNGDTKKDGSPAVGVDPGTLQRIREEAHRQLLSKMKTAGNMMRGVVGSPGLDRMIDILTAPKVNWRTLMQNFLSKSTNYNCSYASPDRRFLSRNEIMPGPKYKKDFLKDVVVGIDTSGSIGDEDLGVIAGHLTNLCRTYKCNLRIVWWDTEVAGEQTIKRKEDLHRLKPKGGGGTCVNSFLRWYEAHTKGGRNAIDPAAVMIITDGCIESNNEILRVHHRDKFIWLIVRDQMQDHFVAPYGKKVNYDPNR